MPDMPPRKPLAVANWKMAMTVMESLTFVQEFHRAAAGLEQSIDIVLCPPYTALYVLSQALAHISIDLAAQDLSALSGKSHTGAISAELVADAGCTWALLGHWEIRRRTGDTNKDCNAKMHVSFQAGLRPILLIGEAAAERDRAEEALAGRLPDLFAGCNGGQVAQTALIYEPEWTIGGKESAPPDYVAAGCSFIRGWVRQAYGADAAKDVRVIYGGSVAPEYAEKLLASPDVDGLGAGRQGRDPVAFARIVKLIASVKGLA